MSRQDTNKDGCFEQLPVDGSVDKYRFDAGPLGDFARIVTMSNNSTTQRASMTEYHHNDTAISIEDVTSFILRGGTIATSDTAIASFVGSMPQQFTRAQSPNWTLGVRTPTAARNRLYKGVDPDDSNKMIGVLLEQDTSGYLTQITWYKTVNTGPVFGSLPTSISFSLVTDAYGAPSTDPNDIGGWTWYYA